ATLQSNSALGGSGANGLANTDVNGGAGGRVGDGGFAGGGAIVVTNFGSSVIAINSSSFLGNSARGGSGGLGGSAGTPGTGGSGGGGGFGADAEGGALFDGASGGLTIRSTSFSTNTASG